ncbi:MAG: type III-A CRISPR-associated RAMP protein Csm4 [Thermoplasmata archaeon]
MVKFKFYSLNFVSQFTNISSIKIESAVIARALELYPEKMEEILGCFERKGIIFSDPFPIIDNHPMVTFPKIPIKIINHDLMKKRKQITKNVKLDMLKNIIEQYKNNSFVILDDLQEIIKDDSNDEEDINSFDDEIGVNIYREPISRDNKQIFTEVFTKEYVSKGVLTIYENGSKTGIKVWIGVQIDDECKSMSEIIDTTLFLLSDLGISGRKSIGKGHFSLENYSIDDKFGFEGKGYYYLLSRFIPETNEIQNIDFEKSMYSFDIFSGIGQNGKPLGIYRYIVPGSILYLKENVKGKCIKLDKYYRLIPFSGFFRKVG